MVPLTGISHSRTQGFLNSLRQTCDILESLPIPTISAIHNVCVGGGLELALATTLRVSSPFAKLGFPETQLGIIPGAGGIRRLRRLVGPSMTASMVLLSSRIAGQSARKSGLVDIVTHHRDDAGPTPSAQDLALRRQHTLHLALLRARYICQGGPVAIGAALRLLQTEDDDGTLEKQEYNRCLTVGRRDRDEALLAFKEKRPPVFKGA